jgi:deazaflavin-dependent oxidoreductase (nitroreductase family)
MTDEKIYDSPSPWVRKHIEDYVKSGGSNGHEWKGVSTLLLTTRGRKTGRLHRTALIYGKDKSNYVIVASRGGHEDHPNWYLNLREDPKVRIQVGAEEFEATASDASGTERDRLWKLMVKIWPDYENYQTRTERVIPVVVLSLQDHA